MSPGEWIRDSTSQYIPHPDPPDAPVRTHHSDKQDNNTLCREELNESEWNEGGRDDDTPHGGRPDGTTQRRDDLGTSTQHRDDLGTSTQRRDDLGTSTQRRDDLGTNTQCRDDLGTSTQRRDDLGTSTQRRDDLGTSTQRRDDLGTNTQCRDDLGTNTQCRDDLGTSTQRRDDLGTSTQRRDERDDNMQWCNMIACAIKSCYGLMEEFPHDVVQLHLAPLWLSLASVNESFGYRSLCVEWRRAMVEKVRGSFDFMKWYSLELAVMDPKITTKVCVIETCC